MLINNTLSKSTVYDIYPEFINNVLEIYKEEFRFLISAKRKNSSLNARCKIGSYPYTTKNIFDYATAPSISLVIGQACYVLVGDLIKNAYLDQLADIDLEKYFSLRDSGDLVFTNMKYKFKNKIPSQKEFLFTLELHSIKRLESLIIAKFKFSSESYFFGEMSLVANLNSKENNV